MRSAGCSIAGCPNPHRAKGLCSSHYNQQDPSWHLPVVMACVICGSRVERNPRSSRRPVCSTGCRTIAQFGPGAGTASTYTWERAALERARDAGATLIDDVERLVVLERDEWTCYLCGIVTDPDADALDRRSPTVDHVIPLSRGGDHSYANVRCACLSCNSQKADLVLA